MGKTLHPCAHGYHLDSTLSTRTALHLPAAHALPAEVGHEQQPASQAWAIDGTGYRTRMFKIKFCYEEVRPAGSSSQQLPASEQGGVVEWWSVQAWKLLGL